ncbi:hypothetical protein SAMN05428642_102120 [Flaviramulus basaltis]|uniref:Uncharacterized protein n=1 Tax=Flaviramulus basaltis TaxID=369401 RepID=A0A1K2IGG9_9FLAO|nr:hypothetical protein SAMN05428642_102120 [Flaviramulus basaltis]
MNHLSQNTSFTHTFFVKGSTSILATTTNITTLWGC